MKLKNIQIVIADKAIEALIALKLPLKVRTNYKLAQISISIRSQASIIEMTKAQLLSKHDITEKVKPEDPKALPFFKEWREMADIEVEVETEKIKLEELDVDGANIPIEILRDLNPFIEK
jgi:hypothetical protein